MIPITTITHCRICKKNELKDIISLGEQYITSRFPLYGDNSTPKTPIDLCRCLDCGLLQLKQTTFSSELYEYEYGYRSGISNTMREHLKEYQQEILSIISSNLHKNDIILDIGSNDSTMLQYYHDTYKRIGMDPTGLQFQQYYGNVELIPTYFTYDNFNDIYPNKKCKIISSISMFYDLPDPVQFAKDIYSILDNDGIWTCEQSYLPTMLQTNSIDTICHEHLEYYALMQIKRIADMVNFKIIHIQFNQCNGGSFRIYFAKRDSLVYNECSELIDSILKEEMEYGIMENTIYEQFMEKCNTQISYLTDFIDTINSDNKNMYIYGASTKGNCLLQYAKIDKSKIKYAVERNEMKIGKMTSTGIEIIGEEQMRQHPPNYLLVLPWHFRKEIIERETIFLQNGGQLVFPFPHFEIVSYKPKVLITGCDGMIAYYTKQLLKEYTLYGITRTSKTSEKNITKIVFDLTNSILLEKTILSICPDIIIHLASISSSHYAFKYPIHTLETNGMITVHLCNIIFKHHLNIKLFNASSSEIYKGHVNYTIEENDTNMYHLHPYSIAKIMGHSMVNFYRKTYGLPFSNGIIFTTESERKRPEFLLNKVKQHANQWKQTKEPLQVGNLDSYRNIVDANDVANAICIIIEQDHGDDYLICNDYSIKIYNIVISIYEKMGISLEKKDNILYDVNTGLQVVIINDVQLGFDNIPTNIQGNCQKLKQLGWKPTKFVYMK
jgi:GDP-mannose 4,6-dehydratase